MGFPVIDDLVIRGIAPAPGRPMQLTGIWGRGAVNPMRQFLRATHGLKNHKQFGRDRAMSFDGTRDYRAVLFPALLILSFFGRDGPAHVGRAVPDVESQINITYPVCDWLFGARHRPAD
jgi:hypothetical protein